MADSGGEVVQLDTFGPDGKFLHPPGRVPSTYNEELALRLAELIATNNRGLKWLCENVEGLPPFRTVQTWQRRYPAFAKLIEEARQEQADVLVDECLEIADDESRDRMMILQRGSPREVADLAGIARAKIRIDTRFKMAKMLHPAKYGDKLDINARVGGFARQDEAIDELD